jgi:hypothetical protein
MSNLVIGAGKMRIKAVAIQLQSPLVRCLDQNFIGQDFKVSLRPYPGIAGSYEPRQTSFEITVPIEVRLKDGNTTRVISSELKLFAVAPRMGTSDF